MDYYDELKSFADPHNLAKITKRIQFPFTVTVAEEKTQEELDKITERKREAGRRLQEQAAKQRLEKVWLYSNIS